jgi:hypothetical protein
MEHLKVMVDVVVVGGRGKLEQSILRLWLMW